MTDYTVEIAALKQAIATGALEVSYDGGRRVRYDSFEKLLARLRFLESQQNGVTGSGSHCAFATFDRGDR